MQGYRLYRGQSKKHRSDLFIPSALRGECIKYMENKLLKYGIDIQQYKQKCVPNKIEQHYCNSGYQPPKEAFYAYWLSLVNCSLAVNDNPICFKFCKSYAFTKNLNKDNVGAFGLPPEQVAEVMFCYAKDFFDSDKHNETLHLYMIFHDLAFFQHFNHVLSKLDKDCHVFFPTLALDWTWNKSIAERFANADGEKGTILSISWEAYEEWNPLKKFSECNLKTGNKRTIIFGFESYRNNPPWNKYAWNSCDNNLLIEQEGAVVFWPWKYTIDQLKLNDLCKVFDFIEEDI